MGEKGWERRGLLAPKSGRQGAMQKEGKNKEMDRGEKNKGMMVVCT